MKAIFSADPDWEGIDIDYNEKTKLLTVGGWYNGDIAIDCVGVSLYAFLTQLGITKSDVLKALEK